MLQWSAAPGWTFPFSSMRTRPSKQLAATVDMATVSEIAGSQLAGMVSTGRVRVVSSGAQAANSRTAMRTARMQDNTFFHMGAGLLSVYRDTGYKISNILAQPRPKEKRETGRNFACILLKRRGRLCIIYVYM